MLEQNESIGGALEWFKANSLAVNNSKTEKKTFTTDYKIYINVQPVKL